MFAKHDMGKMETQLKGWGAKLDALAAQAGEAKADGVEELKAKVKAAQAKFDELREAGADKWEILKDGVESAWGDLEAAFEKMTE